MASDTEGTSRVEMKPNPLVQWAGIAGVTGAIIWWVVATVLGRMWSTYNAVNDPISLLAAVGAPHAVVQQFNFYVMGASVVIFAIGLFIWSDRGWRLLIGVPLLVVFGTGVIVAGFFQFDPNNLQAATTRYHILASLVTFPSAVLAISITSWGLGHDDRWPTYWNRFVPLGIAILAIGLFVIFMMSISTRWEGLTQRMFLLVLTGWVAYHAYTLQQLTRR